MKCAHVSNARSEPLFCSLNPIFTGVVIDVERERPTN